MLYAQYILPFRRVGTSADADIKRSSYKKLDRFLKALQIGRAHV